MTPGASTVTVRSDEVTWQRIDDAIVVLDQSRATYLRIAGAGLVLWPLIAEGTDESALADRLVAEYGIAADVAATDVREFLDALLAQELIVGRADVREEPVE